MGKTILCACEDVTVEDVHRAWAAGHRDLESVKRYTGLGTGPCQGKSCMCRCALLIASRTGMKPASVPPFTTRPPLTSTPLKFFARRGEGKGTGDEE